MKENISEFIKTKDFLVCVDSDGCAMDTMDVKHQKCFGPKAIEVWGIETITDRFMEIWNDVNLYSRTRGINRFKGLVLTFELAAKEGLEIPSLASVKEWTETTNELSNPSLEREIAKTNDEQLMKALEWSHAVNQAITELSDDDEPFPGVKEGLARIEADADVAIVSSANSGAVRDEWTRHQLTPHVQVMLGQEAGTKTHCIGELKKFGYDNKRILMVGDAPGDLEAAEKNNVYYYPILVGKEGFSWERLANEALGKLLDGTFNDKYQKQLIEEFHSNLK
ncbi:HAD hydrolase-like protein [Neobacillus sp. FSL H8-0543]|uniref:HAD family hydrolase n=1 Tax=Neobacillus sp. FSL H8-0543 TaxID=2954672 RepID=UPI0031587FF4